MQPLGPPYWSAQFPSDPSLIYLSFIEVPEEIFQKSTLFLHAKSGLFSIYSPGQSPNSLIGQTKPVLIGHFPSLLCSSMFHNLPTSTQCSQHKPHARTCGNTCTHFICQSYWNEILLSDASDLISWLDVFLLGP